MTTPHRRWDPWSIPTLILWLAFFAVGFLPEEAFMLLRWAGRVVTQNAMVNSPYFITLGFSGYLAFFVYSRCREAGQGVLDAQGRAWQVFIVALLAFLNIPVQALRDVQNFGLAHQRHLIYFVYACKSIACLYLVSLMVRYYLLGRDRTFSSLVSVFPSSYLSQHPDEHLAEPKSVVWLEQDHPRSRDTSSGESVSEKPEDSNKEAFGP